MREPGRTSGQAGGERDDDKEAPMDFDYTLYEYLPECKDGCGAITEWLNSREMAREAGENHGRQTGHRWVLLEKMREK